MQPHLWSVLLRWLRGGSGLDPRAAAVGALAEHRAEQWLREERGMFPVTRNWRNPADRREEIDLVLRDGPTLVFVEVKARAARARVPGVYAVGPAKRAVLRRAVRAYLAGLRGEPRPVRFDVVEVETDAGRPAAGWTVRHFPGVPLFPRGVRWSV